MNKSLICTFCLLFVSSLILAQDDEHPYPSLSPRGQIMQVVGNTTIEIEYERPSVRKRSIFGGLVPWNKLWRTGAGHCTKISFSNNVFVEGQLVKAGKYSLFTIPNPDEWIIILNRDTTLYGTYNYDPQKDVARFVTIPQETSRYYETLNFDIEIIPNDAEIYFSWAHTQLSFSVGTTTHDVIEAFIRIELIAGEGKSSNSYAGAAEYRFFQGTNLLEGITLAQKAIDLDPNNGWARNLKIKLYEKMKYYEDALAEIELAKAQTCKAPYDEEKYRENDLRELAGFEKRIRVQMER